MSNRLFGSFRDSSKLEKVQQTEFPIVIFCFLWIIVVVFWESIDNTEEKFKQKAMIMGTLTIIELVIFFVLQIVVHMVTGMTGFSGIWSAMTGYICAHTLYKIITIIHTNWTIITNFPIKFPKARLYDQNNATQANQRGDDSSSGYFFVKEKSGKQHDDHSIKKYEGDGIR